MSNKITSKKKSKQLMSGKLRQQYKKSNIKFDSIYAAHRNWGSGKAR